MLACKDEHVGNSWIPYVQEAPKHDQKWICPTMTERGEAPYTEVTYVTKLVCTVTMRLARRSIRCLSKEVTALC